MDSGLIFLIVVVALALAFDFTNGFHDAANAIATSVSTRALRPRTAVVMAGLLNFAGAFVSIKVAASVATGIVESADVTMTILAAALIGSIVWNITTCTGHVGFPVSTTHTISGAIMGAGASRRVSAVRWGIAGRILIAWLLTLPAAASVGALCYAITRLRSGRVPGVTRGACGA